MIKLANLRKITFITVPILLILLVLTLIILSVTKMKDVYNSFNFSPFQKTKIGITSEQDIQNSGKVISKNKLDDGTVEYLIDSVDPIKKDEILVKDGVVVYEETSTLTNQPGGFPKISYYQKTFGNPEEKITGSKSYGAFAVTYIYASRGFAVVGNPATDNIYEVQRFSPTTIQGYKDLYGKDLNADQKHTDF